ncbi:MAG: triphosphoribosyl-dephospho-CoA synthase [Sulfolobaceae archaeon]|nr:triphosphoribosyl-dephospho-CoA synthase [Sulfolobaceae archaeon]
MYKDMLDEFCNSISYILSYSTVLESMYNKPGNASRYRDIKSVRFEDLISSALIMKDYYKDLCIKGYNKRRPIFDSLYYAVLKSKEMGINFSILGTALQLIPLSFSSLARSLEDVIKKASITIRTLDERDSLYFSKTLSLLNLSYLGFNEQMDYREMIGKPLYEVLVYSSRIDSSVKNMLEDYKYSLKVSDYIEKLGVKEGVIKGFLEVLCELPDGLVYRKHGGRVALEVSNYACEVIKNPSLLEEFDKYLIQNNLNPGSTADIVAVGIVLNKLRDWYDKNSLNYSRALQRGCDRIP